MADVLVAKSLKSLRFEAVDGEISPSLESKTEALEVDRLIVVGE